jgi:hypothetical protein
MAPKAQIFKAYFDLEMQLGEMDRCRKIFEKWLEWSPSDCHAWTKFASFEKTLDEVPSFRFVSFCFVLFCFVLSLMKMLSFFLLRIIYTMSFVYVTG